MGGGGGGGPSPAGQQAVLKSCNTTTMRSRTENSQPPRARLRLLTGEMSWNHHKVLQVTGGGVLQPVRLLIGRRSDAQLLPFSQRVLSRGRQEVRREGEEPSHTGGEVRQHRPGARPGARWRNCCRNWLMENPGDPSWRGQEPLQRRKVQLEAAQDLREPPPQQLTSLHGRTGLQEGMGEELVWKRTDTR